MKIYWYKLYADYGPGHQSHSEEYISSYKILKGVAAGEIWSEWAEDKGFDDAVGNIKLVRKLPEKVRLRKIEEYKDEYCNARDMLNALKEGK